MKIIKQTSPYIHKKVSVERMMIDVLIALLPIVIFSVIMNGFKAVYVILISLFTMILSELVFVYLTKQDPYDGTKKTIKQKIKKAYSELSINNILAPSISALIYSLIMPAGCNPYIVFIGALFGIVIGKLVFGGLGSNIFNPAALGRVIVMISMKLTYQSGNFYDVVAGATPLGQLEESFANINNYSLLDMFLGIIPGSMGETPKLLIILCGGYLLIRHSADFRPTISMLLTFMLIMFVAGLKIDNVGAFDFMLYEVLAGGVIFASFFMVTDPVTSPVTKPGRIWYGVLVGIICAFIRLFGIYPEGCAFAILIGNMLVPVIDYYKWSTNKYSYKNILAICITILLASLIVYLSIGVKI